MISHLSTDTNISPTINQQAAIAGVGAPIQAFRVVWLQIFSIIALIILIASIAWLGYHIYAYFTFISLTHLYPNIADVPSSQFDHYSWMQTLHDDFWNALFITARAILLSLTLFLACRVSFTMQMYLCT